ncbi:hypothetical protein LAWI1_G000657 [Lachnellula willkommii]|uniref:Uncharacterized protein n=1 Tax=Lachnellula willkommii TaxID=215461 RepID=A0A559MIR3_9HELO|nr:hypothetical protein LAWI1_G000657 [Lachnellula willkommii]
MENLVFKTTLNRCRQVQEATTYFEMFCYSDPTMDTVEEHPLTTDKFDIFLDRKGAFAEPILPDGVSVVARLRLILQQDAQHPETFTPHIISLDPEIYSKMVHSLHLPKRGIESSSCAGPFFWAAMDQDEETSRLHIVQLKSDVRKKGHTRGWELLLSHDFSTGTTTGFCKGTQSSDIVESIRLLKGAGPEICHPLPLPLIILGHDASFKTDSKQRDARDWLRRLENGISIRTEIEEREKATLEIQRSSLYNIISQKESKLNFKMAGEQRKLAHASKRDSSTMKTISLLGSVFLPGAYLAVINILNNIFQLPKRYRHTLSRITKLLALLGSHDTSDFNSSGIMAMVGKDKREEVRGRRSRLGEKLRASEDMEKLIIATMRKRTMSKVSTWGARVEKKESLARDEDNDYGAFKEPKPRKMGFGKLLTVPTIRF